MNSKRSIIFLCVLALLTAGASAKNISILPNPFHLSKSRDPSISMGFSHGLGVPEMSNLFISRIAIYNISGWGIYWNGHGMLSLSSSYYSPYPGDELISSEKEKTWGSNAFGLTYTLNSTASIYLGYSTGYFNIETTDTYFDPYYVYSYNGYYNVIYHSADSSPGLDFGLSYELVGTDTFGLNLIYGYNTSFNAQTWGVEIEGKLPKHLFDYLISY